MQHVLLYDGDCGLCSRSVQYVLQRDVAACFAFAALQSAVARELLAPLGATPERLDTVYVISDFQTPRARLHERSDATLLILRLLGGPLAWAARFARWIPRPIRNAVYDAIAARRRNWSPHCLVPTAEQRVRFLAAPHPTAPEAS